MGLKSTEIQNRINELTAAIQGGASDFQLTEWETELEQKKADMINALNEEAQQQERIDAQEAEIESIELPLDFNELLSDGEFKITKANDMIIEVVKEDRRAQNVIHNAEIARINADWTDRINTVNAVKDGLEEDINQLQKRLEAESEQAKLDANEISELNKQLAQMGLEKKEAEATRDNAVKISEENKELYNAACEKRNNAIRMLEEANGTNEKLRTEVDRLQNAKTSGITGTNISQTNRLAELQAEVTREKAARGIARFNEQYGMSIPTLNEPDVLPVNPVTEEEAPAQENSFQSDQVPTTELGMVDQSLSLQGAETDKIDYEYTSLAITDRERIIELEKGLELANELLFDLRDRVEIVERHTQVAA